MSFSISLLSDRISCEAYIQTCNNCFGLLEEFRLGFAIKLLKGKRDDRALSNAFHARQQVLTELRQLENSEDTSRVRRLFPYAIKGCPSYIYLNRTLNAVHRRLRAALREIQASPGLSPQFKALSPEQQQMICRVLTDHNCYDELQTLIWCAESWDLESLQHPMPVLERLRRLPDLGIQHDELQALRQRLSLTVLVHVLLHDRPSHKLCRARLEALLNLSSARQWQPFRMLQADPNLVDIVCFYPELTALMAERSCSPELTRNFVQRISEQDEEQADPALESALIRTLLACDARRQCQDLRHIRGRALFIACTKHFGPRISDDRLDFLLRLSVRNPKLAQHLLRLSSSVLFEHFASCPQIEAVSLDEALHHLRQVGCAAEAKLIDPRSAQNLMQRFETSGLEAHWLKRDCVVDLIDLLELPNLHKPSRDHLVKWAQTASDNTVIHLAHVACSISLKTWISIEEQLPGALALMREETLAASTTPSDWLKAIHYYGADRVRYLATRYRRDPLIVVALGAAEPTDMIKKLVDNDRAEGEASFSLGFRFTKEGLKLRDRALPSNFRVRVEPANTALMPPGGIPAALGKLPHDGTQAQFALALARELLRQPLDTRRLMHVKKTAYYQNLAVNDHYRLYLDFLARKAQLLMRAFKLASGAPAPLPNSRMALLKHYTDCTPAELAVAALLTEPRQSSLGSCFGTHLEINLHWSVLGLEYTARDYCELLQTDALTRRGQRFPVYPQWLIDDQRFDSCNLLARAREFALSSMAGARASNGRNLFIHNEHVLKEVLRSQDAAIISDLARLSGDIQASCIERIEQLAINYFNSAVQEIWLNPPGLSGTWRLRRIESDAIINSPESCKQLLAEVVYRAFDRYLQGRQASDQACLAGLRARFLRVLGQQSLQRSHWDLPDGADGRRVLSTYFEQHIQGIEQSFHSLTTLMGALIRHVNESKQQEGLLPLGAPGHMMNLLVESLRDADLADMLDYLRGHTDALLRLAIEQQQIEAISAKLYGPIGRAFERLDLSSVRSARALLDAIAPLRQADFAHWECDLLDQAVDHEILHSEPARALRRAWAFADTNWPGKAAHCAVFWSPSANELRMAVCSIAAHEDWILLRPGQAIADAATWCLPQFSLHDYPEQIPGTESLSKKLRSK